MSLFFHNTYRERERHIHTRTHIYKDIWTSSLSGGLLLDAVGDQEFLRLADLLPVHQSAQNRAPRDHLNIRILTMVSGIFLISSLGTRMSDPNVLMFCVVFFAPDLAVLGF